MHPSPPLPSPPLPSPPLPSPPLPLPSPPLPSPPLPSPPLPSPPLPSPPLPSPPLPSPPLPSPPLPSPPLPSPPSLSQHSDRFFQANANAIKCNCLRFVILSPGHPARRMAEATCQHWKSRRKRCRSARPRPLSKCPWSCVAENRYRQPMCKL